MRNTNRRYHVDLLSHITILESIFNRDILEITEDGVQLITWTAVTTLNHEPSSRYHNNNKTKDGDT